MGEIDTDPIKSVRTSVSHFGEKFNQIKSRSNSDDESDKEKDLEVILQDLANCKVQLEAMDSSHKQALLKQHNYENTLDGLSTLLKTSEFEKDIYINECKEAKIHISQLESKIQEMTHELTESNSTRTHLETQLVVATNAKLDAMKQAEMIETTLIMEKLRIEEITNHANNLNETILNLRIAAMEANNVIDSLKSELQDYENQAKYIELLETESTQLKIELGESKEEVQMVMNELEAVNDRENDAQVEIALLKAELHKGRSRSAVAEAAELKAKGEKSAAYFALQQMAIENQETKRENQRLLSKHEEVEFEEVEDEMGLKSGEETESLKRDLESAIVKVSEFRTRAEQATTRAEVAEQAKAALEEQVRRWKEQKQRRRAAMVALREESMSKSSYSFEYDENPKTYMPLGKFLKMNF